MKQSALKSIINLGVDEDSHISDAGKTRLVNITCLLTLGFLLISTVISATFGSFQYLYLNFVIALAFLVPFYLNAIGKNHYAKILTIFFLIAIIIISTMVIGYQAFYKYTIIIPIFLASILLEDLDRWLLRLAHATIVLFVLFTESIYFINETNWGKDISEKHIYDLIGYVLFIMGFIIIEVFVLRNLKRSQNDLLLYKKIFDFSREGISVFDNNVVYLRQNRAHEDLLGFSDKELIGKTPAIHMGEKASQAVEDEIFKNGSYHGEIVSKTKKGSRFIDLLVFLVPLNKQDFYLVGIMRDITEKKKVELQVIKNDQELKQVIATKDRLFSIIAHDLKSPFNTLIGFSDLLLEEGQDYSESDTRRYLTHINQLSVQTLIMLENLLDWSQMETGALIFQPQMISIKEIFDETLLEMKSVAAHKKIELVPEYDSQLTCKADKRMMQVVVRNLVSNAIKYSEPGNEVCISAEKKDDQLVLTVSDNGIGMSSEVLQNLFNSENKISTPGTQREKGSGLGLVLCHEFVEKNGGSLTVRSEPGKGSDFVIHLPQH